MLLALPSPVPLFGSVSYYLLMILRSSTDRGPSKALCTFVLRVCLGLGSRRLGRQVNHHKSFFQFEFICVLTADKGAQLHKSCCCFSCPHKGPLKNQTTEHWCTPTSLPRQVSWPSQGPTTPTTESWCTPTSLPRQVSWPRLSPATTEHWCTPTSLPWLVKDRTLVHTNSLPTRASELAQLDNDALVHTNSLPTKASELAQLDND